MELVTKDLMAAVGKHLPEIVGEKLRGRLEQADRDAVALEQAQGALKILRGREAEFRTAAARQVDATTRERLVLEREGLVAVREEIVKLHEAHAAERVAEMRSVVGAVFANNRYKYQEHGSVPAGLAPQYAGGPPMPMNGVVTKTVETEG